MDGKPPVCALGDACCGCGACAAVCPVSCIDMRPDDCGFCYPSVNAAECRGCGVCGAVCPVAAAERIQSDAPFDVRLSEGEALSGPLVWWAYAADESLRASSSSGGVFGVLARDALARGGAVYGAAFENGCTSVSHIRVSDEGHLPTLMKSKYVQSHVSRAVYERLANDVRGGTPTLFVGTACQVAGIRMYLRERCISDASLVAADVVCHGAPAPALWSACVSDVQRRLGACVDEVNFRDKRTGWETYSVTAHACNGKQLSIPWTRSWYMAAFLKNASLRPACFRCPFKRAGCGSDLTIGDYWGISEAHPEVESSSGVSAVIVRTELGLASFERIAGLMVYGASDFERVAARNPSLLKPVEPFGRCAEFMSSLARGLSLQSMRRRWGFGLSLRDRMLRVVQRIWRGFHQGARG